MAIDCRMLYPPDFCKRSGICGYILKAAGSFLLMIFKIPVRLPQHNTNPQRIRTLHSTMRKNRDTWPCADIPVTKDITPPVRVYWAIIAPVAQQQPAILPQPRPPPAASV